MTAAAATKSSSFHNTMFEFPNSSPMPYMAHQHDRDLVLQQYYLLHEQHESLRQHLDELRSPAQPVFHSPIGMGPNPVTPPTQVSPLEVMSRHQFRSSSIPTVKRCCSMADVTELAVEEAKLCDVNEGIKRALTELLNCEDVRSDRAFRTWVQSRLMDTERELRSRRRRRSAPEA
ncbi:hypothetical protein QBC38DRAFT_12435 [Podospora fimiseda]|uniref:Uncharacterized protein n=1 Tax=Podospora fimiseda TaxID=252190 RepID=A0AAN7BK01_9PEZI|nr:hypothetical protein QBC38DRAFT_12435 [Podospora fimiseda]